jgi:hypothetical protein
MSQPDRHQALQRLEPLVGEWSVAASLPDTPTGRATFEWALGGQFLIERSEAPDPIPDSLAVIRFDEASGTYSQHYYDSRGVVRVYAMTFGDGEWTLLRTEADFSPLPFAQRFTSTFDDGGDTISGRWEQSDGGSDWELDFELVFTRLA